MPSLTMPNVGEGVTEGEIVRWLKQLGDFVARDEPVVEIETDKAIVEIPSPYEGTLTSILVPEGETVPIGTAIAEITTADSAAPEPEPEPPASQPTPAPRRPPSRRRPRGLRPRRRREATRPRSAGSRRNTASTSRWCPAAARTGASRARTCSATWSTRLLPRPPRRPRPPRPRPPRPRHRPRPARANGSG